jgi:hypothetical protein
VGGGCAREEGSDGIECPGVYGVGWE